MAHELLDGLSDEDVKKVLELGTRIKVSGGAPLFRLGDPAHCLYLIETGRMRLTLPMRIRGREEDVLIEEKGPGQTVGWSALIPPYRFTLSAIAPVETEAIALSRQALHAFFDEWPAIGSRLCLNLALVVGHRLQTLQAMWLREMQRTVELHSASAGDAR